MQNAGSASASGTGAGVLRDFGGRSPAPQNRVALASATLSDSSGQVYAAGGFS